MALALVCATMGWPALAAASDLSAVSPIPLAMTLLHATVLALCTVAALGLLSFATFHAVCRLRLVPRDREFEISRQLRIVFGALVIFAATLPYLVLNFSPAVTAPLGIAALMSLTAFVWTQQPSYDREDGVFD